MNMTFDIATSPDTSASQELADFLIVESRERGDLLTPLKLQKLMFYADAWSLALYEQELTTERFQAWVHGPVALSQYHRFKENRWRPILDEIDRPDMTEATAKHLCEIVDIFGVETGPALEAMTHQELPWIEARGGIPDDQPCNAFIDKNTTKVFYAALAAKD
ncbi:type II toxin-antitoxin system antitoxin SocA domain-containing protein [uncultured Roseobacter sp.]|uniref:Panacea domain-containing protein n=1 Tax=uncultured Roseobacter sp. TaxID=114847 RepID=UPI00260A00CD|nr:type II toxin-antitoxin system antitoxin SocA domain-containing protein [uncultured Roseobacter sp.]